MPTFATITGRITIPGTDIGIRAEVTATPLTTDNVVIDTDRTNWGPATAETKSDGTLTDLKIPLGVAPVGVLWRITVKPLDKRASLQPWTVGIFDITESTTLQALALNGVEVTAVTETMVTDVTALVAQAEASVAAAIAVGNTNDTIIASRVNDPASASTSAIRNRVTGDVLNPASAIAAAITAAITAQALSDKGAGFITKLDQRQPSAAIAFLSDSTGFRNASGFYVGTDGREWPKQVAKWIADTYSRVAVNYRLLSSDAPVTYAANQVIADGVTGGAVTYVLSDDFVRAAGPLPGTSGTVGSAWTSNSGATSFNLDGSGNAVQAADTATTAGTSAPGRLKTTWVYELVPTVAGTVNLLGAFIDGSNILWMTDNSNDQVTCKVSTTAGGTVTVHTFTYADAGVSATATADVTASIEHKTDGTVVFTFGAATYTHTLSAGDDAKFAATSRAGMSGSRVGYKMRSITATSPLPTTPPDTTVEVYNGSYSSKDAQWSQANYAALVPVAPDVLVISHSHNHEAETPATFEAALDALVATAKAAHPNAAIVIASQNPEMSPAPNRDAHAARLRDLRRYARVKGFGYLPIYEAFMAQSNPAGLLNSDGVHPLPSGIDLIGTTAKSHLKALSVRPA